MNKGAEIGVLQIKKIDGYASRSERREIEKRERGEDRMRGQMTMIETWSIRL